MHKTKRTETKIHFRIKYFPQLDSVSPYKESDKKHFYVETPFGFLKFAKFIDKLMQVFKSASCENPLTWRWGFAAVLSGSAEKGKKKNLINSLESEVRRINFVQLQQKKYDLFLCK